MKKILAAVCFLAALSLQVYALDFEDQAVPAEQEYVLYINSYDWGPAADKAVINAGKTITPAAVSAEDFTAAIIVNTAADGSGYGIVKGHRTITAAYLCDGNGRKTAEPGTFIALELSAAPYDSSCSPFFSMPVITGFNQIYGLKIENEKLGISISVRTAVVSPLAARFMPGECTAGDMTLQYVSWEPAGCPENVPLIIWLHGISGGGKDPYTALLDAKNVSLISPQIQNCFSSGACVLIPQCPTSWFETTTKGAFGKRVWEPVDVNGTVNKITKPVTSFLTRVFGSSEEKEEEIQPDAAVSYYSESLKHLIDEYTSLHPYIDRRRIYIGGYSAGGYMAVNMCIQYPETFAAVFTASEAYVDGKITGAQIKALAKMPLWFVYALNDTVIKPDTHAAATIERLKACKAENLHISVFTDVHDTSGLYKIQGDEDDSEDEENPALRPGAPYQYQGHESWIYILNGECSDNGIPLFQWLSEQKR